MSDEWPVATNCHGKVVCEQKWRLGHTDLAGYEVHLCVVLATNLLLSGRAKRSQNFQVQYSQVRKESFAFRAPSLPFLASLETLKEFSYWFADLGQSSIC